MESFVDFLSEINSIVKGNYTFFPRFTLMRMAGLERREERIEKKVHNLIRDIAEDEKKGNIRLLTKDERAYIRNIMKEEKIEDKEIRGEEKIELNLAMKLKQIGIVIKKDKQDTSKVVGLLRMLESFLKTQFNDLTQFSKGGTPWTTATIGIMKYDIGECSNIAITKARSMRKTFSDMDKLLKRLTGLSRRLKTEKDKSKVQKDIDGKTKSLENDLRNFLEDLKFHFYVMLRLFRFLLDEIRHEIDHERIMEEEKLPKSSGDKIKKALEKAMKSFIKKVESEINLANKTIQELERSIATVRD